MYPDTATFDLPQMTIRQIHAAEREERFSTWTVATIRKWVPKLPARQMLVHWVAGIIAAKFDEHAALLAEKAVWFEGATARVKAEIIATGELPPPTLPAQLDEFLAKVRPGLAEARELLRAIQKRNPNSRYAPSIGRAVRAMESLETALVLLREVALGRFAKNWEDDVAMQAQSFREMVDRFSSGDVGSLDADLLQEAEDALAASAARDLSADKEWATRLSSSQLH